MEKGYTYVQYKFDKESEIADCDGLYNLVAVAHSCIILPHSCLTGWLHDCNDLTVTICFLNIF